MNSKIDYQVNSKENLYYLIRLITSMGLYAIIIWLVVESLDAESTAAATVFVLFFYFALIVVYLFMRFGVIIGHLKGNAIKITKDQFPDIYQIVSRQSELLGLDYIPSVYLLQSDGVMNAFASRFLGSNYIVLYSEIVEISNSQDKNILEFIIGHELGHIKRNHMVKKLLLFPSYLIPFLGSAYSRACEYTCDNIGYALCPEGAKSGILLLASGKNLYKKVNIKEFISQDYNEDGFWTWFAEKVSSHPNLTKRLASHVTEKDLAIKIELKSTPVLEKKAEEDYSRFMPN